MDKKYFVDKNKKNLKNVEPHEILLDTLSKKNEEKWGSPEKRIETPLLGRVFQSFLFFCFFVFFGLFIRTFYLQIVKGKEFSKQSDANKYISYQIEAERGVIYDKNLEQLVFNIPVFNLACLKDDLAGGEEGDFDIREISRILGEEEEKIREKIDNGGSKIIIKEDLNHQELIILKTKQEELQGFKIEKRLFRDYKNGEVLAHVLGYAGKITEEELENSSGFYSGSDYVGKSGIEKSYENYLRKVPGKKLLEKDVSGQVFSEETISLPESGKDLVLYLDFDLQKKIKESLENQLNSIGGKKAVAIAMDPKTGGVLSLVSLPSFDNNIFAQSQEEEIESIFQDSDDPLFNRAISGIGYPTGSVIKPLVASAALQEEVISADRSINCQGLIEVEHEYDPDTIYKYHDWDVHGVTDMRKAIAESCNVYFYSIGGGNEDFNIDGLGAERIKQYLRLFGWGDKTGIDLPNEGRSILPVLDNEWRLGNTYHFSIGQGAFSILPIQVTNAFVAIANGGTLFEPQIVKEIVDSSNSFELVKEFEPQIIRKEFIDEENLKIVREGMRQTVTGYNSPLASAQMLGNLPVSAAAKTGTAEVGEEERYHNWITVFAPYEDPEIVLTIVFEDVAGLRSAAVPVAKEVLDWYFTK